MGERPRSNNEDAEGQLDDILAGAREILDKRMEAFRKEEARLREILKTRRLTDEERKNFNKMAMMGPLPEEEK